MGFPVKLVLGAPGDLIAPLVCTICQELSLEPCVGCPHQHVFCAECLHTWMTKHPEGQAPCPNCQQQLRCSTPLREASPVAFRILSKVQCQCPLRDQGCSWSGDYSEVSAHLTNSESHRVGSERTVGAGDGATDGAQPGAAPADNALATAEALKEQGNALFEGRRYREAMNLYSKVTLATAAHMRRVVPSDCPPPTRRS
jgi:DnaJ family protein C protein 7